MANTITQVTVDKIFAGGLMALRENAVTARKVYNDFSSEVAQKGENITINLPSALVANNVSPSNTLISPQDSSPTARTVTLDQWKESNFHVTDKQLAEIDTNTKFIDMQTSEAIKAIGNAMDVGLLGQYIDIPYAVGTPGTTPFASDTSLVSSSKRILTTNLAPKDQRVMLIDEYAQEKVEQLAAFASANQSADPSVVRTGDIGYKYGYEWHVNQNVPVHTKGTLSGTNAGGAGKAQINNASVAVGDTSIDLDDDTALTGTMVAGDIFTVAGDTQTYTVVTGGTAASDALSITFYPGAKVAWADNAILTMYGSGAINMAFHPWAFALAARPLGQPPVTGGNIIKTGVDPVTGIPLRLEIMRQNKQTVFQWDALWGYESIRRELAVRIYGQT